MLNPCSVPGLGARCPLRRIYGREGLISLKSRPQDLQLIQCPVPRVAKKWQDFGIRRNGLFRINSPNRLIERRHDELAEQIHLLIQGLGFARAYGESKVRHKMTQSKRSTTSCCPIRWRFPKTHPGRGKVFTNSFSDE